MPTRVGKKRKRAHGKGPEAAAKLPAVTPHTKCRLRFVTKIEICLGQMIFILSLRLLKQERIKDYLLMEEEFIRNQERLKPQDEKNEEERSKVINLFVLLIF